MTIRGEDLHHLLLPHRLLHTAEVPHLTATAAFPALLPAALPYPVLPATAEEVPYPVHPAASAVAAAVPCPVPPAAVAAAASTEGKIV